MALPNALLGRTCLLLVFSHTKKASRTGLLCSKRFWYRSSSDKSTNFRSMSNSLLQKLKPSFVTTDELIDLSGIAFNASSNFLLACAQHPTILTFGILLYPA